jgi:5-methylcytosine-specific restriction endonuclease McrA
MKQKKSLTIRSQDLPPKKKETIPRALREQVWIQNIGPQFEHKCLISWCQNIINVFDYHVGHNIPESKGGATNIKNLKPICARCNLSMGNKYSITEWAKLGNKSQSKRIDPVIEEPQPKSPWWICC